jgi:hypothetical protein
VFYDIIKKKGVSMLDFVIVRMLWGAIETFATIEEATAFALSMGIKKIEAIFTHYECGEPVTYGKIIKV